MNPDRWQQIEALYHSALEAEADKRAEFLAVACAGDEELRREVLSLLSSSERADSFLEEPVVSAGLTLIGSEQESLVSQNIGRYRLLELLGRGGMGEVYLAHDPRLNRRLALKLLPAGIDDDHDRVRRFEQEACAASAISHPNVAHVYEIGEEQGRRYITMEYVRGQTLRHALQQRPMEAHEALDVAIQVASALAAAHEVGVVHRDIKPENIMLRADGYVKVLDFGLAKLVENRLYESDPDATPFPSLHTGPQLLMGTADYMSPEQVRRQPADTRTDLWSLGVLLYEMLGGRRPFRGREPGEVIVAILEREPEPLGTLRQGLPQAIIEIVSKALSKRIEDRYQTARSFEAELRNVRRVMDETERGFTPQAAGGGAGEQGTQASRDSSEAREQNSGGATGEVSRPYGALGRMSGFRPSALTSARISTTVKKWRTAHWLVLVSLVGVGFYLGFLRGRTQPLQSRELNLRFERLNLSGDLSDIVLSPDGKYVASVVAEDGQQAIHVTELATASKLAVAPPSKAGYNGLSFSPDGTYIYYLENRAETGTLYRVSKFGGGQRKILDNVNTAVTFSPDGSRMAFVRSNNSSDPADLIVAQADGQSPRVLAKRKLADANFFLSDMKGPGPAWSPDGKTLVCPTRNTSRGRQEINLEALDAGTGDARRINTASWYDISRVTWLADGSGLVVAATEAPGAPGQLHLLAYPDGDVRRATSDPNNYTLVSGARDSGLFLTRNIEENSSVWQIALTGGTQPSILAVNQKKGVAEIEWGADGQFLYTVKDGNHANLWVESAGAAAKQITFEADNFKPTRSPDGRYVVFVSTRAGAMNIWRINADGTQPIRLTTGSYEDLPSVTPDGRWVVYRTGSSIKKVSIDGGNAVKLLDKSALCPALSPDGRRLAFFTNDKPDSQVWHIEVYDLETLTLVRRFELPEATSPFNNMTLTPDNRLRWTPDGQGLAYASSADGSSNIWLQPLDGQRFRQLTYFRDAQIPSFTWSADGKHLACIRNSKAYVPVLIRMF